MKTFTYALVLVLLFSYAGFAQNYSPEEYKADYIEACKLFSHKYVYFERKYPLSRKIFFNQQKEYADSIKWDKKTFIEEIRKLCAHFPDGHVSWEIPIELSPIDGFYTLGFVPTFTLDSHLVVKKTYPHYNKNIQKNDTIISTNGMDSKKYIKSLSQKAPQSTPAATLEKAARNYSLIKYYKPLTNRLKPQNIVLKRNGKKNTYTIHYKRCNLTTNPLTSKKDSTIVLLNRNVFPSLEELPKENLSHHPSLVLYEVKTKRNLYCVLHPRDFNYWNTKDVDSVMSIVNSIQPDALVIDLKDCSGGGFRPVFALSHGLGVKKEFQFFYDIINEKNRRITGISNFNMLTDTIDISSTWNGKLLIRSNEMCGSGCDFFIRWMKINKRGMLIGTSPEGRGGGYDSFKLTHTGTVLDIPLRERIPFGYPHSIEGDVCKPDLTTEERLMDILRNLNLSNY